MKRYTGKHKDNTVKPKRAGIHAGFDLKSLIKQVSMFRLPQDFCLHACKSVYEPSGPSAGTYTSFFSMK